MCEAHVHANADMNMYTHANPHHSNTHAHNNVTQQVICDDFATWSTLTHKWTQFKHMHCWRQGETSPPRTKREIQIWTDTCSFRQVCRPSCRRGTMRGASRTSRAVAKGRWRTFHWKWNLSCVQPIAFAVRYPSPPSAKTLPIRTHTTQTRTPITTWCDKQRLLFLWLINIHTYRKVHNSRTRTVDFRVRWVHHAQSERFKYRRTSFHSDSSVHFIFDVNMPQPVLVQELCKTRKACANKSGIQYQQLGDGSGHVSVVVEVACHGRVADSHCSHQDVEQIHPDFFWF